MSAGWMLDPESRKILLFVGESIIEGRGGCVVVASSYILNPENGELFSCAMERSLRGEKAWEIGGRFSWPWPMSVPTSVSKGELLQLRTEDTDSAEKCRCDATGVLLSLSLRLGVAAAELRVASDRGDRGCTILYNVCATRCMRFCARVSRFGPVKLFVNRAARTATR